LKTRLITPVVSEKPQARAVLVSLLLILSFNLSSCGGTPQPGTISNGNWWMKASSSMNSGQVLYVDGPLVQTGSSVSGTMLISTSAVDLGSYNAVVLSGNFSGGTLRLAASLNNGCSMTLKLTGNEDNLTGTYATTGEAAACNDRGTAVAGLVHPIDGTWIGTIHNIDGTESPVSVSINLAQGTFSTANADSPLTGTGTIYAKDPVIPIDVSSTPCAVETSSISGAHVRIDCPFLNFRGRIVDPANSTGMSGFTSSLITGTLYLKKIQ
jgi:hypothetical protein